VWFCSGTAPRLYGSLSAAAQDKRHAARQHDGGCDIRLCSHMSNVMSTRVGFPNPPLLSLSIPASILGYFERSPGDTAWTGSRAEDLARSAQLAKKRQFPCRWILPGKRPKESFRRERTTMFSGRSLCHELDAAALCRVIRRVAAPAQFLVCASPLLPRPSARCIFHFTSWLWSGSRLFPSPGTEGGLYGTRDSWIKGREAGVAGTNVKQERFADSPGASGLRKREMQFVAKRES